MDNEHRCQFTNERALEIHRILDRKFYSRSPLRVARELIGKILVRRLASGEVLEGIIVETEAYGGKFDPASHAFRGKTERNSAMFGEPGRAYVYFTYGAHFCLNFVTGRFRGEAAGAVLIRALEPIKGTDTMRSFRNSSDIYNLTSGPGKLCRALAIDRGFNGCDITKSSSGLYVRENPTFSTRISTSRRIGINSAKEKEWRFIASNNLYISRGKLIYPRSSNVVSRP